MKTLDEQIEELEVQLRKLKESKKETYHKKVSEYIGKNIKIHSKYYSDIYLVKVSKANADETNIYIEGEYVTVAKDRIERSGYDVFKLYVNTEIEEIENIDQGIIKYIQENGFFKNK